MMKKIIKLCVCLLCAVAIFATSKIVTKASQSTNDGKETKVVTTEGNNENRENQVKEDTFTYRLYVDKLDNVSYYKGHNGIYNITYSINGGEEITKEMSVEVEMFFNNSYPAYYMHYVDVENVKEGDVIDYVYSYNNNYLYPDEEPLNCPGSKVVS